MNGGRVGASGINRQVAVLFARGDSVYKSLDGCDVWDEARDARNWPGGCPVVAHPPCRAWGKLKAFAKPRPHEKDLARMAVNHVRKWGGVLEHPATSTLWQDMGLPRPGATDAHSGWTLAIRQSWFGHRAEKATWLYIVGVGAREIPALPFTLGRGRVEVQNMGHAEREHTPRDLALWLCELARKTKSPAQVTGGAGGPVAINRAGKGGERC